MLSLLSEKIRQVTEEDKGLPYISYSKLSNFEKCPLSHKLKYIDKHFSSKSSLAMEIGSILHKVLELKGQMKLEQKDIDYKYLIDVLENGYTEEDEKSDNHILGVADLKKKYFEEYYVADNKSGMNYEQKVDVFIKNVLPTRIEDEQWRVLCVEKSFEFVYDNRVVIHGFIDRVDTNDSGDLRIIDYKSSKAPFSDAEIKTPMQHITYDLACIYLYGKIPIEHQYDFILIDKIQDACSKGYLKRGIKKLDKLLDDMDNMATQGEYPPKPTPLCFWCPFHTDSPNADSKFSGLCQYHSLWTPENRNFKVLNPYEDKPHNNSIRKLIF